MSLPIFGRQPAEVEGPAKEHKKSGNLKSIIKTFLFNLPPIRRTLALLVILFHVLLLLYLTLIICNVLSPSVSPQASPKFQDGESRVAVNISKIYGPLPNKSLSKNSSETHGSWSNEGTSNEDRPNKGILDVSSTTSDILSNKGVPNISSEIHSSLAKEGVSNVSSGTHDGLAKQGIWNITLTTSNSNLAEEDISNTSSTTSGSFPNKGVSNISSETHDSLGKEDMLNISSTTYDSFPNTGASKDSSEAQGNFVKERGLNISSTVYSSLSNKGASNFSSETHGSLAEEGVLNISSTTYDSLPDRGCDSGQIYVYDLPTMFNYDIVNNCTQIDPPANKCDKNLNDGLGPMAREFAGMLPDNVLPAFYWTDAFWGEVVFHNRMLNHKCRTLKPESATAFYLPFYAGLGLTRYLLNFSPARERDWLPEMFDSWLRQQKWWKRSEGSDHFIMLGRITWEFRRGGMGYMDGAWGSRFLLMPSMRNVIHLSIERNEWDDLEIAVPYPSVFHPRSESDIVEWQSFVRSRRRNHLFTFVGGGRSYVKNDFRGILKDKCLNESTVCRHVDCGLNGCADGKTTVMAAFLDSDFCLQPRGDSLTRRSVFDCMLAGSIPVFFWRGTAYLQYEFSIMPNEPESYSVFIDKDEVRNGTDLRAALERYGREEVERMREKVIEHIPRIMYAKPSGGLEKTRDAFDVVIGGVLTKYKDHMARGCRLGNLDER